MLYIKQLSALAHAQRLAVFRLLVQAGSNGMYAGDIAEQLQLATSSLSGYLGTLEQAGLLLATRDGRFINYRIETGAVRGLFSYLISDCCAGRPELCDLNNLISSADKVQTT